MSLILNWVVGPALMFALAWIFLPDLPEYRTGLIIVGLARCIAMVLIWNDLASSNRELAAVLVAINSVFQIVAYSILGYFYLELLPGWLGLPLLVYSAIMWIGAFAAGIHLGLDYERNTSIAFTAAGNNFELAIAVAIGVFGGSKSRALCRHVALGSMAICFMPGKKRTSTDPYSQGRPLHRVHPLMVFRLEYE
jgi:ACR3 family arsenite efflux pump ArsB